MKTLIAQKNKSTQQLQTDHLKHM